MSAEKNNDKNIIGEMDIRVGDLSYKRLQLQVLRKIDFARNDRIIIATTSGNRYLLRWSKSADTLKIYSERTAFKDGYPMIDMYAADMPIAEVGQRFSFKMKVNEEIQEFHAKEVTSIEVTKDIDADIESGKITQEHQRTAREIFNLMRRYATGKVTDRDLDSHS